MHAVNNCPGGHMVSKKLKGMLVVAAATMSIVSMGALAQAPGGGPPGGGPPGGGRGGGFQQPTDVAGVIQQFGLGAPELKITDAQKASIEKLANVYLEDMKKVPAAAPGGPPSQEVRDARNAARTKFTAELGKILTPEQNKTFEAAQAARRGGGPGGGGGFGGPPGGGPPGGGPPGGA
jgi:Spy/CpxP family protein refolding chaperone